MKVLYVDRIRFLLPDNFQGSASDALRILADHLETKSKAASFPHDPRGKEEVSSHEAWKNFEQTLQDGGKLWAQMKLLEWDPKEQEWLYMPLNIGSPRSGTKIELNEETPG
jgi:hypothetical protein